MVALVSIYKMVSGTKHLSVYLLGILYIFEDK